MIIERAWAGTLIYTLGLSNCRTKMIAQLRRTLLYALYQLSVVTGITLLPVALLARRAGISLPVHRVLRSLQRAVDEPTEEVSG